MIRTLQNLDRGFVATVLALVILGLYNLDSAGKPLGHALHATHAAHLVLGFASAGLVAWLHYRNLEGLAYPILVLVLVLLLATMLFGRVVNGSRRWLSLGFMSIQTSDLAKLALIIVVARTFHGERWGGVLTLGDIFRPLNLSRPLCMLLGVTVLGIAGDSLAPAKLQGVKRSGPAPVLTSKHPMVRIGRTGEADLRLPLAGVDAEHAEVTRESDGVYMLRDLGSDGGTFVNGERVEATRPLRHGDRVRFGSSPRAELRFSAQTQGIRPLLPWLLVVSLGWLLFSWLHIRNRTRTWSDIAAPVDVVLLPCALVLVQPDLGTTLILVLIAFSMILFVGLRPSSLLALIGGGALFGVVAWFALLKPYQKKRVVNFLQPEADLAGAGYHQHQSLIAVGSGELWGKGHGQGTQTQLSFLPEQQTDFIFSVWAEEQGFVGSALVVVLFAGLLLQLLRIGLRARDRFGCLLVVGVTAMLFWHTVTNMLMVLRLAPVVGVPLPLWSNGGSFVLTTMVGLGIVVGVDVRRKLF